MILTEDLAHRIERVAVTWSRAWMAGVEAIDVASGLPDHVLAACHPARPDLDFQNRVNGLTPDDVDLVPRLLGFYAAHGVRPWFEVVPSDRPADLLRAIDADPIGFHAVVLGRPAADGRVGGGDVDLDVDIQVIDPADDEVFATFCRVRTAAHELPPDVARQAAADLAGWRTAPGATLYLARVDGRPAATAALASGDDGVAYLADGATLRAFRGRGLQFALIRRRLADGARAGCDVAASQASFGSASHRNLQRAGLVHGFTKLVLRRGTEANPHH